MATAFIKDNFTWDGMYLNYDGDQGEYGRTYEDVYGIDKIHPSRIGSIKEMFIARFKHGSKPYKRWINFIVKNFTVEEWVELERHPDHQKFGGMSPAAIMATKGYMEIREIKLCKKHGLEPTVANYDEAIRREWK